MSIELNEDKPIKGLDRDQINQPNVDKVIELLESGLFDQDPKEALKHVEALPLLNVSPSDLSKLIGNLPKLGLGNDGHHNAWTTLIDKAAEHNLSGEVFVKWLMDETSDWTNKPMHENRPVSISRVRAGKLTGPLSGESAVVKVKASLGLGSIVSVPLWHTGGWISLKGPKNATVLELLRKISEEKITLGRLTNGMIYSNTSVYMQSYLIHFVLNHVYDTNLGTTDPKELRKIILSTDIPSLIWGMLCAMYPDGYDLMEPCVASLGECNHVSTGRVNISRLHVIDRSRIDEKQVSHMSRPAEKLNADKLTAYQNLHKVSTRRVKITDEHAEDPMYVDLTVPTIEKYLDTGFRWVNGIVDAVERSFQRDLRSNDRDNYITDQGRISTLRQYAHWVERIQIGEDDDKELGEIVDPETIDAVFDDLSGDETCRVNLLAGVAEFIDDTTVAIVGYPNTPCPACGLRHGDKKVKDEVSEEVTIERSENAPEFIPLDISATFFTLSGQRLVKGLSSPLS